MESVKIGMLAVLSGVIRPHPASAERVSFGGGHARVNRSHEGIYEHTKIRWTLIDNAVHSQSSGPLIRTSDMLRCLHALNSGNVLGGA